MAQIGHILEKYLQQEQTSGSYPNKLSSYVYNKTDTIEDLLAKLPELNDLLNYEVDDEYLKHKVIESLRKSKSSENFREFIRWAKRSDDITFDELVQKLKAEILDIREQKEEKFQNRKENKSFKSFNTYERHLINAGFNIN